MEHEDEVKCREWVLSQVDTLPKKKEKIPVTESLFSIIGYLALPSIQRIALNYGLQQLSQGMFHMSNASIQHILTTLLSLPFKKTNYSSTGNVEIDNTIASHMYNGKKIATKGDYFREITESNQILMILMVSILSLYFQYKGMNIMQDENKKYQTITSKIDNDMDNSNESWIQLNTKIKKYIFSKYNDSSYYNKELVTGASALLNDYHPVRIVYNTLVGINHSLFYIMGGRSDDPTHEIIHWTKILFYWEILARLLSRYGLGPMQIATNLFLHDIWSKTKTTK